MDLKKDHINVCLRIRPVLVPDDTASSAFQIISKAPPVLLVTERGQTFQFDHIFPDDSNQEKVYNDAVKPFVDCVKNGYNCTVFAYGQTGTGKTYTMGSGSTEPGNDYHMGIIPRALKQLFDKNYSNDQEEIDVSVSFSEIYNEKVFDLLQVDKKKAPLPVSGFAVQGLSKKSVVNVEEANDLLELGSKNRHIGETKQNFNSSRSHAIFTVYYTVKNSTQEITAKLNLVDLAGSESVKKTGAHGNTFQEGININKGLLTIGQVIKALSMKSNFIPYRESMITTILQGSLNVDNYILLISCVSAHTDDVIETMQTLEFAQKVKKIKSNPEVNLIVDKFKKTNSFGRTPMKRPNSRPMKTPSMKKMGFPFIDISSASKNGEMDNNQISAEALSPIMKKYMTKIESSIMERVETVIQNTLRRPTRASLRASKLNEKENTPNTHWNKIENKVSKMIKNEIAQMRAETVRATSSPIEMEHIDKLVVRRLQYHSSADQINSTLTPIQNEPEFKIPEGPIEINKRRRSKIIAMSPAPRRSMRLSLKRVINLELSDDHDFSIKSSKNMFESTQTQVDKSMRSPKVRPVKRKSIGKYTIPKKRGVGKTPSKILVERAIKFNNKKDSPYTSHSKKVLDVLNKGTQRDIERLHSIGAKTAEQILLFRKLKGRFSTLEDLTKIPGWGVKKYQKFISVNFLKKE